MALEGGNGKWTITGKTDISGSSPAGQTIYQNEFMTLDLSSAGIAVASFTATSPGNDTLDLGYNIFGADGTPGGTLTSMTVSLYTSASGMFDDQPKTWIASYAVNSGDLLTGAGR